MGWMYIRFPKTKEPRSIWGEVLSAVPRSAASSEVGFFSRIGHEAELARFFWGRAKVEKVPGVLLGEILFQDNFSAAFIKTYGKKGFFIQKMQ